MDYPLNLLQEKLGFAARTRWLEIGAHLELMVRVFATSLLEKLIAVLMTWSLESWTNDTWKKNLSVEFARSRHRWTEVNLRCRVVEDDMFSGETIARGLAASAKITRTCAKSGGYRSAGLATASSKRCLFPADRPEPRPMECFYKNARNK